MSVLVYTESEKGNFKKIALEVASYAKAVANQMGTTVTAITINANDTSELGKYGVDKVLKVNNPSLDTFNAKTYADVIKQAAEKAKTLGKHILLTLGSKNIEPFLCENFQGRVHIRMLPDPKLIDHLLSKGVPPARIIAIQGPFSVSMNQAMIEEYSIDCLITKSSGKEGGVPQKISAAKELGVSVIVIKRPDMNYPVSFCDKDEVIKYINNS